MLKILPIILQLCQLPYSTILAYLSANSRLLGAVYTRVETYAAEKAGLPWPDCRLAPGTYHINVGFGDGMQILDYVENAATFDVLAADLHGTGKMGTGIFIPSAEWLVE